MLGGQQFSPQQQAVLDTINPHAITNFQNGGGLLPNLAMGAAAGSGASHLSLITPNRLLGLHDVLLVADFIPRAVTGGERMATIDGITIRTTTQASPDPLDINDYVTGANTQRR